MVNNIQSIPHTITIGITGHRQIDNEKVLSQGIHNILNQIKTNAIKNESRNMKFSALSPLAEGADRLFVNSIRKYDPKSIIKIVLPLTVEDYTKDFKTQESKDEFLELLKLDPSPLSLKNENLKEEYPEELRNQARKQAYENVGRFVVDHCDIMIAIWDGKPANGIGGTGEIVKYALEKKCPIYIIDANNPESIRKENEDKINLKKFN